MKKKLTLMGKKIGTTLLTFSRQFFCYDSMTLKQGFPSLLLRGPFYANLLFCGPQLNVTLLSSPDSLTIAIIKIQIQFIRQCDGRACFTLHNSSIFGAICNKQTRKSDSTFILDLYFVFILASAENALSHMYVVAKDNKIFVGVGESSGYSFATLNQKDAMAF